MRRTLPPLWLLLSLLPLSAAPARLEAAASPPMMREVCRGASWTLVGPGWRIRSIQQFVQGGGTVIPSAVKRAQKLPHVQYWVTQTTSFENTCNGWSGMATELGTDRRSHSYLYAISMTPLRPGTVSTLPFVPSCGRNPWRYLSRRLRSQSPQQFRKAGGALFPRALLQARRLPHVRYWLVHSTRIPAPGCAVRSMTVIEVGANRKRGTYLMAISVLS